MTKTNVRIKLPKDIQSLPESERQDILGVLAEAMRLPSVLSTSTRGATEHNMWSRSSEPLMPELEDGLYEALAAPWHSVIAELFYELDLPTEGLDMDEAFSREFREWEGLQKSGGRSKISDFISLDKQKRDKFLAYMQGMNPFSKEKMKKLDDLMKIKLPKYAKIAEDYILRAAFLGKIRDVAERELLQMVGAVVDRYPQSIKAAEDKGIVLTLREKQKAEAEGRKVTILPLSPQEAKATTVASHHAADKMKEISDKHRAGVRQLILRAQKERWGAGKLAQTLFDMYGDQNRDWRRVAITELAMASNDAYLLGLTEGETVVGMGADNACKQCKQYVIGKTFSVTHALPKEDYEHDMKKVWAGKSNYGRRLAEYVPCIPLHPNCRCRWHRVSRFYKMGEDGKLVLKTTAELINEERAKRGLPPDPNLK
jgi:hypothetical protein